MANVRIDAQDRASFTQAIGRLCNSGLRFVRCPVEATDFVAAHNSFMPKDLLDSIEVVERYHDRQLQSRGTEAEYMIEIGDGRAMWLRVRVEDYTFFNWPDSITADWRTGAIGKDVICGRGACQRKVIPAGVYESKIGADKFAELVQWGVDCIAMEKDIVEVIHTFDAVLTMANTIGQVSRMVPDLLRYAPRDLKIGLSNQQKQSRLPAEWVTFDKQRVERMLELLAKFHLLNSIESPAQPGNAPALNSRGFNWAHTLELERK
jgi:hypothetical protein